MLHKANGQAGGNSSPVADVAHSPPRHRAIEDLAREARQHTAMLENVAERPVIAARELRKLWNARLRPFWRLHLGAYQALTKRLVELGENYFAIETAAEGLEFFGDDPKLVLSSALAAAR